MNARRSKLAKDRPDTVKGELFRVTTESMDLQANAVAHHDGKVVFVRGALAGETGLVRRVRSKPRFDVAELERLERESPLRVRPRCPSFGVCGGCSMQHLAAAGQIAIKQRGLEDQLKHLGGVRPEQVMRPLAGPDWGYRYRARLSVRHVPKKGGILVGFHERGSSYVADMRECFVLPPEVSRCLVPLRDLIAQLSIYDKVPQIELAIGERAQAPGRLAIALVFRVMATPSEADMARLSEFAASRDIQMWLQPKGPDTIYPLEPDDNELVYRLPEFGLSMPFRPTDFTQVNHHINRALVNRAVALLDPQAGERIADFFCGLGNFSLPMARRGGQVFGYEGNETLCERARQGAARQGLAGSTEFRARDLFKISAEDWQGMGVFQKVLIDPPRDGAMALVNAIAASPRMPERVVYVSCNPATLARDAGILVHRAGYRLRRAGVINMFPHTSHVESIALFER